MSLYNSNAWPWLLISLWQIFRSGNLRERTIKKATCFARTMQCMAHVYNRRVHVGYARTSIQRPTFPGIKNELFKQAVHIKNECCCVAVEWKYAAGVMISVMAAAGVMHSVMAAASLWWLPGWTICSSFRTSKCL